MAAYCASVTLTGRWGRNSWLCESNGLSIPRSDTTRPLHVEAPDDGTDGATYSLDLSTAKVKRTGRGAKGYALMVTVNGLRNKRRPAHVTLGWWKMLSDARVAIETLKVQHPETGSSSSRDSD